MRATIWNDPNEGRTSGYGYLYGSYQSEQWWQYGLCAWCEYLLISRLVLGVCPEADETLNFKLGVAAVVSV